MTNYELITKQIDCLMEDVKNNIANFANASALLYENLSFINWCGFYLVEDNHLVLGPFQGKVAHSYIDYNKGVCGTTWAKGTTTVVANVHEFEGHIACDTCSNSEIVVPIYKDGKVFAVLDIDSPNLNRFSQEDKEGLELYCKCIEKHLI